MNTLYFLFVFLILNCIWLLYIWKSDNSTEEFSPKFISSSYDEKLKIQFKSRVLQSLSPYIFKFLPSSSSLITSHTGDIPIGLISMSSQLKREKEYNISLLHQSDIGKNRLNSEYEMFLDEDKKNIYMLKMHINYNYSNDKSLISMYSIPIDNFIISTREQYNLNKSCINKIWEYKIDGIIHKYSISQDKNYLGIIVNKIQMNNIISNVKYLKLFNKNISYYNKSKNNIEIINSEETNFSNLKSKNDNSSDNLNFFKNEEISINGNLPLINIDISKDIIILSRESKEYVDILIRNNSNNKWEEFDINEFFINQKKKNNGVNNETFNKEYINEEITYYNRINSFKILSEQEKLSILELYVSIKSNGIFANTILIDFNKKNLTSKVNILISYRLDKSSNEEERNISYIYDIKTSLSKLKEDYLHNSIFSKYSMGSKILNFEFFHKTLVSLNLTSFELEKIETLSLGIESIQSDSNNNNLIVIDNKKNIYYFYKKNKDDAYEDFQIINLNNIPNKYRKSEILSTYIETFEKDKTRLLLLLNKGVIVSLDFEKIIKKMNRNLLKVLVSDYFYSIFMMCFNLLILIIILKKRKQKKQRNNDIRNAIGNLGNQRRE